MRKRRLQQVAAIEVVDLRQPHPDEERRSDDRERPVVRARRPRRACPSQDDDDSRREDGVPMSTTISGTNSRSRRSRRSRIRGAARSHRARMLRQETRSNRGAGAGIELRPGKLSSARMTSRARSTASPPQIMPLHLLDVLGRNCRPLIASGLGEDLPPNPRRDRRYEPG